MSNQNRPPKLTIEEFVRLLKKATRIDKGWTACCPAHDDSNPSLSVTQGSEGQILVTCHRGCNFTDICRALHLEPSQLFPEGHSQPTRTANPVLPSTHNWRTIAEQHAAKLSQAGREALAVALLLPIWGLEALPLLGAGRETFGQKRRFWTFPECDSKGAIIGINRRYQNSEKKAMKDSKRGLTLPSLWRERANEQKVVLAVEGGSDTLACAAAGLAVVGRYSATGGADLLAAVLEDLNTDVRILIVGENDQKPDGSCPGRDGAMMIARRVASVLKRAVGVVMPPEGHKDSRAYLTARAKPTDSREHWATTGCAYLAALQTSVTMVECSGDGGDPPGGDPAADIESIPLPPPRPRLDCAAFYGVLGQIVQRIEPETEADPAGILLQLLVAAGSAIGRGPYIQVEGDRHRTNLFGVIVGPTSSGRKGTSWGRSLDVLRVAAPTWAGRHIRSGSTTGEGIIYHVRDRRTTGRANEEAVLDAGADVKNVLILETEFASVLRRMAQSGNTLSAVLRQAWDGHTLASMSKQAPDQASEAHIAVVAHITREELQESLGQVEVFNGFGNRFLWATVERTKVLPRGGRNIEEDLQPLVMNLGETITVASQMSAVTLGDDAGDVWDQVYADLTADRPGLGGVITARAAPQVLRLALVYALLDRRAVINETQLRAALAVWRFCQASALQLFGGVEEVAPLTSRILNLLHEAGQGGLTRTEVNRRLGGHYKAADIVEALAALRDRGQARCAAVNTGGRPKETWWACGDGGTSGGRQTPPVCPGVVEAEESVEVAPVEGEEPEPEEGEGGLIPQGDPFSADLFRSENASGLEENPFSAFSAGPPEEEEEDIEL